ncbi:MAG: Re/Si-specific NAD(P)(+) transhydrogenase subunit alpha [Gemmatimonadetes bacterium]|nr:Re/Si-specific NAD(P)(+) transhydrogenase subunit alpha [Gemmatimonadota bacterium]MXX33647.1 Re/Si-specific NAD(P)(+) transhydrogenase subunit alpha [Gemmatimonadota bacterium]MYD15084.1 Re/Si-specific NAD(P)(+) transhydrogenase subunit alpha [Gemmatimonadota bacterium]MYI66207.1 Re/Si-specific NAD(P)(+) transhydrogenase subunit alpha [Gemmatimonadota bacterium]
MTIAIMAESRPGERRVALVPEAARFYTRAGHGLRIEAGAGVGASFPDREYEEAGVAVIPGRDALLADAEAVLKVQPPTLEEVASLAPGSVLVCHLDPLGPTEVIEALAERGVTAFAVELIPRITRAQKMDVLSSQATVAGYKAVLFGAGAMTRFLPMLTTAAGTVRPAKAMILGAGVAGLQAIATARRLGAVVSAFDIRPAVKEQVQSLGATFLEASLDESAEDEGGYATELSEEQHRRELELIATHIRDQDLVVTTAQIPGRPAPVLITAEMVATMRPGSVIVDLASETGGNCELTVAGRSADHNGVTVMGPANLPAELPYHASQMYARNLASFVEDLFDDEGAIDFEDEITSATCVTHGGEITNERVRASLASTTE